MLTSQLSKRNDFEHGGCFLPHNVSMVPPGGYITHPQSKPQPAMAARLHPAHQAEHLWKFKCVIFLLYFSREEKALTFAVRCWNALQLKEVEQDLHLQTHRKDA